VDYEKTNYKIMKAPYNRRRFLTTLGAGIAASQILPVSSAGEANASETAMNFLPSSSDKLYLVDIRKVRAGGEIGRRIGVTIHNNLLKIDIDKDFLHTFMNRDLSNESFVGLGMLLDATVKLAANTGNEKVLSLKEHLVSEIIKSQEPDGYIGNMRPPSRMRKLWDVHETGYIIYGLVNDFRLFSDARSLMAAEKAARYIIANWEMLDDSWEESTNVAVHVAITGIHRTMLALFEVTGQNEFLEFCLKQHNLTKWNPGVVTGRKNLIVGHIYGYMASSLAQLELYRLRADKHLLQPAKLAMDFLTLQDGMAITGGAGQVEIWTNDQDGRGQLGETCATAYQIRVYDNLLRLTGNFIFGDLMERTIFNALFGAQSPDGRHIRYFTPTEGPRVYHNTDTYCCPNNYRRIVADLPSMMYYTMPGGMAVNLYTDSQAELNIDGLTVAVRQETSYPGNGKVAIIISPTESAEFRVRLRRPEWCKSLSVQVNGLPIPRGANSEKFMDIDRTWKKDDRIALDMDMDWRLVKGRQRQAGRVAVMRGPLLYCMNPAQDSQLAGIDGADLGKIIIDSASIEMLPVQETSTRPEGTGCRLKAGKSEWGMGNPGNLPLVLSEFTDPDGKCTYFKTPEISEGVDDELIRQTL
jgi:uncharacterized protein